MKRIEAAGVTPGFQEASGDAHAVIPGSFVGEWRRPTHPVSALASTVLLALTSSETRQGSPRSSPVSQNPRRVFEAKIGIAGGHETGCRHPKSHAPSLNAHAGCRCGRRCLGPPYGWTLVISGRLGDPCSAMPGLRARLFSEEWRRRESNPRKVPLAAARPGRSEKGDACGRRFQRGRPEVRPRWTIAPTDGSRGSRGRLHRPRSLT
jgi:hypothetical protein